MAINLNLRLIQQQHATACTEDPSDSRSPFLGMGMGTVIVEMRWDKDIGSGDEDKIMGIDMNWHKIVYHDSMREYLILILGQ